MIVRNAGYTGQPLRGTVGRAFRGTREARPPRGNRPRGRRCTSRGVDRASDGRIGAGDCSAGRCECGPVPERHSSPRRSVQRRVPVSGEGDRDRRLVGFRGAQRVSCSAFRGTHRNSRASVRGTREARIPGSRPRGRSSRPRGARRASAGTDRAPGERSAERAPVVGPSACRTRGPPSAEGAPWDHRSAERAGCLPREGAPWAARRRRGLRSAERAPSDRRPGKRVGCVPRNAPLRTIGLPKPRPPSGGTQLRVRPSAAVVRSATIGRPHGCGSRLPWRGRSVHEPIVLYAAGPCPSPPP